MYECSIGRAAQARATQLDVRAVPFDDPAPTRFSTRAQNVPVPHFRDSSPLGGRDVKYVDRTDFAHFLKGLAKDYDVYAPRKAGDELVLARVDA